MGAEREGERAGEKGGGGGGGGGGRERERGEVLKLHFPAENKI